MILTPARSFFNSHIEADPLTCLSRKSAFTATKLSHLTITVMIDVKIRDIVVNAKDRILQLRSAIRRMMGVLKMSRHKTTHIEHS